jgi:hypothetical protein
MIKLPWLYAQLPELYAQAFQSYVHARTYAAEFMDILCSSFQGYMLSFQSYMLKPFRAMCIHAYMHIDAQHISRTC